MNPLKWEKKHRAALVASMAFGALVFTVAAFLPFYWRLAAQTVQFFPVPLALGAWLKLIGLWWPWPALGGTLGGLGAYALILLRS